jgi:putative autoinducer-2 (AI-2) aldolase
MMDWGLENRLGRILQPHDGRTVMLALDHGYFLGPVSRLEKPGETIRPLIPFADALMLTRGILRQCIAPDVRTPVVLRVSGGNSIVGEDLSREAITTDMEEAIRLNVSAMALSIYVGAKYEHETLVNFSHLVDQGQKYGIPCLAVTAVGKELAKRDAKYLSLCCRIAAELGAHFVKTYYCEDFEKVANTCPVPLVIAGGPKLETVYDAFRIAHAAISAGAAGVDMGRNIWQSKHPEATMQAIRAIVHDGRSAKEAGEIHDSLAEEER